MVAIFHHAADTRDIASIKILSTGVILMLSLLPIVRSATLILGHQARSVMVATSILESGVSVIMLMGIIKSRRERLELHLAATLTRAIRRSGCE